MRQRRERRQSAVQPGAQSAVQPGAQSAVQPGAQSAVQPGAQSAVQPGEQGPGQPGVHRAVQTGEHSAVPPGAQGAVHPGARSADQQGGYGSQWSSAGGFPPQRQPEPRLRFDPPTVPGYDSHPPEAPGRFDSPGAPGQWQRHDDQRPSYGPARPSDQTRPREAWEQVPYPDRRLPSRAPFEPITRPDLRLTGPQPRYAGSPFPPLPPGGEPTIGQPGAAQPGAGKPGQLPPGLAQLPPGQAQLPGQAQPAKRPPRRSRRRLIVTVAVVVVVLLAASAAGGGYLLLRTKGTPAQAAASYLSAWQRGDYQAMGQVSLGVPPGGLAGPITRAQEQLGVKHTRITIGSVTTSGNTANAHFSVTDDLASNHVWTYQGQLALEVAKRHWWVKWSPSAFYPRLKPGERFALSAIWPPRAQILADDGTVLSSPAATARSGSLALLTGYLGPATAKQAKALGAPYRKGDVIGQSGIELSYQNQLAGRPSLTIKIVGPGKRVDATAMRFAAKLGRPVRTSINMATQIAASQAVSSAKTKKPVDLVAMQASTGRVLAVVERPGGFDRALEGIFPPGSTFKIITASALAKTGLTPSSSVQCPSKVNIGGRIFHNDQNEHLGTTNLLRAFAISCNSTFALLATQRLTGPSLAAMARVFGFNAKPELGFQGPVLGHFATPHDPVDLAADAFGQGLDLVNPLSQASVVAAIDSGVWRSPLLVVSPKPHQKAKPHVISPTILNTLRPMMAAVVTSGTAAGVGFPAGVYGKTGTAEYGTGPHPKSHGWFIGYQNDIAFAVIVEGGGFGANSAGPIVKAFLHDLNG